MDSSTLKGMIISLLVAVLPETPERYNEGNDDRAPNPKVRRISRHKKQINVLEFKLVSRVEEVDTMVFQMQFSHGFFLNTKKESERNTALTNSFKHMHIMLLFLFLSSHREFSYMFSLQEFPRGQFFWVEGLRN